MVNLHKTLNPINREERVKINENWDMIVSRFNNLQLQVNFLSGKETEEIINKIETAIANAENATIDVNTALEIIEEGLSTLTSLVPDANAAIENANNATDLATEATVNAIQASTDANNATNYAKSQGDYAKQQGDIAKSNANEALLAKQATETAIANVNTVISEVNQLKTIIDTATINANSATQSANNSAALANQSANNAQAVIDNIVSVGNFELSKTYKKNNLVLNNGTTWMALKDTVSNPIPTLPTTENEFWRLVAQRGVDGKGSVSSVNGISPDTNGDIKFPSIQIGNTPPTKTINLWIDTN